MRKDNWPTFLMAVIEKRRLQPFAWGTNDCVIFAAACIEAVTDVNPIAGLAPWTNEAEAMERMESVGGLEAYLDALYHRVDWHRAQRGDIGIMNQSSGVIVVINVGIGWTGPSDDGLTMPSPADSVIAAWRVE